MPTQLIYYIPITIAVICFIGMSVRKLIPPDKEVKDTEPEVKESDTKETIIRKSPFDTTNSCSIYEFLKDTSKNSSLIDDVFILKIGERCALYFNKDGSLYRTYVCPDIYGYLYGIECLIPNSISIHDERIIAQQKWLTSTSKSYDQYNIPAHRKSILYYVVTYRETTLLGTSDEVTEHPYNTYRINEEYRKIKIPVYDVQDSFMGDMVNYLELLDYNTVTQNGGKVVMYYKGNVNAIQAIVRDNVVQMYLNSELLLNTDEKKEILNFHFTHITVAEDNQKDNGDYEELA